MEYHYDSSGYYSYIMLDASDEELKNVKESLKRANLPYMSSGPSRRPANNGRQYRWYIRVSTSENQPTEIAIENFFSGYFSVLSEKEQLRSVQEEYQRVESEKKLIEKQLAEREQHLQQKITELHEVRDKLHKNQEERDKEFNITKEVLNDADSIIKDLKYKLQECDDKKEQFQRNMERLQDLEIRTNTKRSKEIGEILDTLLPNIEFLQGSIDVLATEVEDYNKVLTILRTFHYSPGEVKWKCSVVGAPGWKEIYFEGKKGRIYGRDRKNKKNQILISFKPDPQHQKRDIEYLRSL